MGKKRIFCLALGCCLLLGMTVPAYARQVDCDQVYCFQAEDFAGTEPVRGICITGLPDPASGTVMLGSRVLQPGDLLTAAQVGEMTFHPLLTKGNRAALVRYLPVYDHRVEPEAVMTLSIRGKENKAPAARDGALETYKNLPNQGKLLAEDPEEEPITYSLVRPPRRGSVELAEDGSFTYISKKNKVGVDSFTFTAADPQGNVSREATITVQILKPADGRQYRDTAGQSCRFSAEWLKNTGLFSGEQIGENLCFQPEKPVTRGEFLSMLVNLLELPVSAAEAPQWAKPYVDAAIRSGLLGNWSKESLSMEMPVTGAEAAAVLEQALTLPGGSMENWEETPVWAEASLASMVTDAVALDPQDVVTRGQAAELLYRASRRTAGALGVAVFHLQDP